MLGIKNEYSDGELTYWEELARTRWGDYITEIERLAVLKANDAAGNPTTALEIGCGGGRWSKLLADLGWDMICTDIDSKVLEVCQRRIPTASCILVSPSEPKLPCEPGSIGLLLCIEVYSVIHSDWFIGEALRVLRPGGVTVGVITNIVSFRAAIYWFVSLLDVKRRKLDYSPYKFSYRGWKSKFLQSGFRVTDEVGFCWFPFSRSSDSRLIPLFTQMEHRLGLRHLTNLSPWVVFVAQKI